MQVQEVMRDNATLKRRIEAMEADIQRRTDADRDKFSVRVSSVDTQQIFRVHWQDCLKCSDIAVLRYLHT